MDETSSNSRIFMVERRRTERRVLVNVAIEVSFHAENGNEVTERTFIEDVSDLGCRFTTRTAAHQGDTVTLKFVGPAGKSLQSEEPRHYRIMWVAPHGRGSTVGARLITGEKPMEVDAVAAASSTAEISK